MATVQEILVVFKNFLWGQRSDHRIYRQRREGNMEIQDEISICDI